MALGVLVLGIVTTVTGVATFVGGYHVYRVSSEAMTPTLSPGDAFIGSRAQAGDLRRGDVVTVDAAEWDMHGGLIIKRVVAVGGDRLKCGGSGLVLNDAPLNEPYAHPVGCARPFDVTVPAGRLFLLGDHRNDSIDSQYFASKNQGTLPASAVHSRLAWASHAGFRSPDGTTLTLVLIITLIGLALTAVGVPALAITLIVSIRRRRAEQWAPGSFAQEVEPADVLER